MRSEKQFISNEYAARLNASPYFIVVDYRGLTVEQFAELRKRLAKGRAEVHVVKNSIFRVAAKEAGITDLGGPLTGQLAVVTGSQDVSVAAKVLKTYKSEFEKPTLKLGFLNHQRLEADAMLALAELPPLEVLRAKALGLLAAPAGQLVRMLSTPAAQLARVLQARVDKGEAP